MEGRQLLNRQMEKIITCTAKEITLGLMAEDKRATGSTESNMAGQVRHSNMELVKLVKGLQEKGLTG